ncbi:hypothetical protein AB0M39_13305 [Streptomyces sp. NPDC051907]|uniref:hypothetical protein n=1 Tax=Streptomyces sp. NPDC051907 TaxID=3155284 RepID=UPI00343042B2
MSEITGPAKAHEAYAFACMRCGHGWEQSYEIEHHHDASGQEFVVYKADGERVPSPLSSPTCINCGGHVVRIMRSGQVSSVRDLMLGPDTFPAKAAKKPAKAVAAEATAAPGAPSVGAEEAESEGEPSRHWHLSDLLHPFHRK